MVYVGHQRQRSIPAGWRGQGLLGLVLCINWNVKRMGTSCHASTNELAARFPILEQGVSCAFKGVVALSPLLLYQSTQAGFIILCFCAHLDSSQFQFDQSRHCEPLTLI